MDGFQYEKFTGLPNMFYFFELAEAWRSDYLAAGEDPVILFIDLNGMKNYNAKFGFAEGDKLILAMANLIRDFFGADSASRFGGDHFAVLSKASGLREELDRFIEASKKVNNGQNLPLNIGVYKNSIEDVNASTAVDRAKMACDMDHSTYDSHVVYFNESMLERMQLRQYIIDNFDRALEEEWIEVYYQPIIRAANGRVCDEESLARWVDPEKGILPPIDFIPVLEDEKMIHRLDIYMLRKTLAKLEAQKKEGLYIVPASINLSRVDFEVCDIAEEVRRIVDESSIERSMISIEITESVLGANFSYIISQIERLRVMGFKVWMDDFGSGYSSPDILQKVHFDTIKFDMQFMRNFDSGEKSRIILTELIKMIVALDVETVMEGVETEEQVEFLREIGCTKLQGYYFCKPISIDEIRKRYADGTQIGFENPDETEYYETLGRLNLYDLSFMVDEADPLSNYFNTMPMVVLEYDGQNIRPVRANVSHRGFIEKYFPDLTDPRNTSEGTLSSESVFMNGIRQCHEDGRNTVIQQKLENGITIHVLIKKIATNPVTGVTAFASVALSVEDESSLISGITYSNVARALSADYVYLYYVNIEKENFIEYINYDNGNNMNAERHGTNFFKSSRQLARTLVYEDDRELFLKAYTKKNVMNSIDKHGSFSLTYRLDRDDGPIDVNLKAVRVHPTSKHIIVGVSKVYNG